MSVTNQLLLLSYERTYDPDIPEKGAKNERNNGYTFFRKNPLVVFERL